MLSRALILATVMLLIGGFAADQAQAQATNLEAGKSPSQIFAGTCNACHKSPRGLLKTVSPGSLPGFLREHYTTSSDMASLLASFLVSNGATDTRYVGSQPKAGKDGKPEAKPAEQTDWLGRRLRPAQEEAAKPGAQPQQAAKRRPGEAPEAAKPAVEGQPPAQAASELGPDGRKLSAKQRLSKRGKPGSEEPPKTDAAKDEPAAGAAVKDDKPKSETAKDEDAKPSGEPKSETAKSDTGKSEGPRNEAPKAAGSGETPALRPDPVPAVTPAPKSADGETRPAQMASPAPASPPATSGAAPAATAEPAPPPAMTASAPPPAPSASALPPAPPISQ